MKMTRSTFFLVAASTGAVVAMAGRGGKKRAEKNTEARREEYDQVSAGADKEIYKRDWKQKKMQCSDGWVRYDVQTGGRRGHQTDSTEISRHHPRAGQKSVHSSAHVAAVPVAGVAVTSFPGSVAAPVRSQGTSRSCTPAMPCAS